MYVEMTNPMETRCIYNDPPNGDRMHVQWTNHIVMFEGRMQWEHDVCTKDQSYAITVHVQRTNPISYMYLCIVSSEGSM